MDATPSQHSSGWIVTLGKKIVPTRQGIQWLLLAARQQCIQAFYGGSILGAADDQSRKAFQDGDGRLMMRNACASFVILQDIPDSCAFDAC